MSQARNAAAHHFRHLRGSKFVFHQVVHSAAQTGRSMGSGLGHVGVDHTPCSHARHKMRPRPSRRVANGLHLAALLFVQVPTALVLPAVWRDGIGMPPRCWSAPSKQADTDSLCIHCSQSDLSCASCGVALTDSQTSWASCGARFGICSVRCG